MRRLTGLLIVLLVISAGISHADLYSEFRDPPREYSPVPFWFLNAELEPAEVEWQIAGMMDQHVYGAYMHGRTGLITPYFSDEWWRAIGAAVEYSAANGFHAWIYDEYNWPSGHANGQVMKDRPEFLPRNVELKSTPVEGPSRYSAEIESDGLIAVLVSRMAGDRLSPEPSIDITDQVKDGKLEWDVPSGRHMVMVAREAVHTNYVDLLNADAMDRFLELTHREYYRRFGAHFSRAIPGTFTDEPNIRSFFNPAWTHNFLEYFREIKGYDLTPYLGALFHDMGSATVKTRCDYYDVVTTLFERNYWGLIAEWSEKHGIASTGHLKAEESIVGHMRMAGDAMRVLRHAQITGIDCVTGPQRLEVEAMKLGSSVAHLYGRDRLMSETYAGCGHGLTFEEMKWMADWQFAGGVNLLVPHAFHYSIESVERRNDWPPSMFYQQPYWPHYSLFADYAARVSRILSGGTHVADVAVHYPIKTMWAGNGPVNVNDDLCARVYSEVLVHLFEHNLDYNLLDDDSLERAVVGQGTLSVGPNVFRAVVLPATRVLTRAGAEKLAEFRSRGGMVICVARRPAAVSDGCAEGGASVESLSKDVVLVASAKGAETVLRRVISPDFEVLRGEKIYYNHIRHGDRDVYFITSQSNRDQAAVIKFRAPGFAELWDASTGNAYALDVTRDGNHAEVELDFAPFESRIVVFGPRKSGMPSLPRLDVVRTIHLPEIWGFSAAPYRYRNEDPPPGAYDVSPPETITEGDWFKFGMESFSGTGVYRASVDIPSTRAGDRLKLDLGDARVVASVYVNDRLIGTRAWRPFEFDITDHVRPGSNDIRIEVTNTIANRMTLYNSGKWDSSPREQLVSGLLGPLRLTVRR